MASQKKGNITWNQSGLKVNTCKWPEVQKNARNKVMIGFGFASDWLRGWRKISGPITEHTWAKPSQSWITFDTQLKIVFLQFLSFKTTPFPVLFLVSIRFIS